MRRRSRNHESEKSKPFKPIRRTQTGGKARQQDRPTPKTPNIRKATNLRLPKPIRKRSRNRHKKPSPRIRGIQAGGKARNSKIVRPRRKHQESDKPSTTEADTEKKPDSESEKAKPFEQRSGESKREDEARIRKTVRPRRLKTSGKRQTLGYRNRYGKEAGTDRIRKSQAFRTTIPGIQAGGKARNRKIGESKRRKSPNPKNHPTPKTPNLGKATKLRLSRRIKAHRIQMPKAPNLHIAPADEGKEDADKNEGDEQKESPESSEKKED